MRSSICILTGIVFLVCCDFQHINNQRYQTKPSKAITTSTNAQLGTQELKTATAKTMPSEATALQAIRPTMNKKSTSVAILLFENRSGEPNQDHWRFGIRDLLAWPLLKTRDIRIINFETLRTAYHLSGVSQGESIDHSRAWQIGALAQAQRVVWGSYHRDEEAWTVVVRVLNVADNEVSTDFEASSSD